MAKMMAMRMGELEDEGEASPAGAFFKLFFAKNVRLWPMLFLSARDC